MKRRLVILLAVIILLFVAYITVKNKQDSTQAMAPSLPQESDPTNQFVVPESLSTLVLSDLQGSRKEIYTKDSPYTLLMIGLPQCSACKSLLEDLYKSKEQFAEQDIQIYYLWQNITNDQDSFIKSVEEKVNTYTDQLENHLIISKDEYKQAGFESDYFPTVVLYDQNGSLLFKTYGYKGSLVTEILDETLTAK
jgi:thioredoxin-related protein